jgi:hypothetical protein
VGQVVVGGGERGCRRGGDEGRGGGEECGKVVGVRSGGSRIGDDEGVFGVVVFAAVGEVHRAGYGDRVVDDDKFVVVERVVAIDAGRDAVGF